MMNLLVPKRSLREPTIGMVMELTMLRMETDQAMAARDQPKLAMRGGTKTPKIYWKLPAENITPEAAAADVQP